MNMDGSWLDSARLAWLPGLVYAICVCVLVDFLKSVIEVIRRVDDRTWVGDPTKVTAVIPSKNGADVVEKTVQDLMQLLPPERIVLIDDGSSDATSEIGRRLGCQVHRFEVSKGKAAAINYGIYRVKTPYVLLLDDDTRIGDLEFPTSLLDSKEEGGEGFDAVAFHVLPDRRNRNGEGGTSFLGHLQRYEYGKSMEIGRRFHDVTKSVSCVSGAIGLFKTRDLNELHHQHTGVFQGEDLQRTLVHLLHGKKIVFVNQPVWTVAPATWQSWFHQRVRSWYPASYHSLRNFLRVLAKPGLPFRLKYEMSYNLYTVISDPLKITSATVFLWYAHLRIWFLALYLAYLVFEVYPYLNVRVPGEDRRASLGVLFFYPIYGGLNTILRVVSVFPWFWMRFVSKTMRPKRGPQDRVAETPSTIPTTVGVHATED